MKRMGKRTAGVKSEGFIDEGATSTASILLVPSIQVPLSMAEATPKCCPDLERSPVGGEEGECLIGRSCAVC
jgi:hypothetical protein